MYTLVELLNELKTLATGSDRDKLARINKLFENPRAPAEYQVGRHYVATLLAADVGTQLDSTDPGARRTAIETVQLVFPRTAAVRSLRRVMRDPEATVRRAARRATRALGVESVEASNLGAWWPYGIFSVSTLEAAKKPKAPARPKALEQYGLPRLPSIEAVAKLVGLTPDALVPLMRPGVESGSGYVEFEIPKAKGGTRRIAAPRKTLRKVQRTLLDEILAKIPMHDACHGFVAGRSTVSNASPHRGAAIVVKLDLKDFFPTVHYRRVRGLFQWLGYNADVANTLAGLTTYRPKLADGTVLWPGVLPQGAPTSPALANLACRRLDRRLGKLGEKYGAIYTRYADDLTFSFKTEPPVKLGRFLWWVDAICQQEGFHERPDKRRILRNKHQQRITGIVVNEGVHVPRADKKRFRAILHNCAKHGVASQDRGIEDFEAYLRGYAAYVHMVEPERGAKLVAEVEKLLRG